jgi:ComEC/Rec2-related protein
MIIPLGDRLEKEYHVLDLWYFVSFISGIICYFSLHSEPAFIYILCVFTISLFSLFLRKYGILGYFASGLIIAFVFGILISKYRIIRLDIVAHFNQSVISKVKGVISDLRPTIRGNQLILHQTHFTKQNLNLTQIKLTVSGKHLDNQKISINDKVQLLVRLYPLQNSILPYSYNFGFYSYLAGIEACGYSMSKITIISRGDMNIHRLIQHIRQIIYDKLIHSIGKLYGNFAAAILIGETKSVDQDVMNNMRYAGISHILCVSGLHLSLVAMIFFVSIRFLLNLSNFIAFHFNIKLIAAICSLIGSFGYLALSNLQIAATRAFIMTAIFLLAIITNRMQYPLRSIAIAAFIILCMNPEYIFHPSFQLSFVAVLSLIAGFEFYNKNKSIVGQNKGFFSVIKLYLMSNIYSSFLASILTAPIVLNQFYIFSTYSIPMNLIAVPIMTFCLMPLLIFGLIFCIFDIEENIFKLIGFFIKIIIDAADTVVRMPYAVYYFGFINPLTIGLFLFGFFWLCIWQTRWRIFGLYIMIMSFLLMLNVQKPDMIFDTKRNIIAVVNHFGILEIYTDKISVFNRKYLANWFGQKDCEVKPLAQTIFTTNVGKKIAINYVGATCQQADVQINFNASCDSFSTALNINKELLDKVGAILIFCNKNSCFLRYDDNQRFNAH